MRAVLKLEFIGENYHAYKRARSKSTVSFHEPTERYKEYLGRNQSRPWVKCVIDYDEDAMKFVGEFVKGQIDYSHANSTGSRGVFLYFPLKDGTYEVNERVTWNRVRHYFLLVVNSEMREIEEKDLKEWLLQAKEA